MIYIVVGIVAWFVVPSKVGKMYTQDGARRPSPAGRVSGSCCRSSAPSSGSSRSKALSTGTGSPRAPSHRSRASQARPRSESSVRGRATGVALPALAVLGLVAVVAIAAGGTLGSGSNLSRPPSHSLLDAVFTLLLVALVLGAVLMLSASCSARRSRATTRRASTGGGRSWPTPSTSPGARVRILARDAPEPAAGRSEGIRGRRWARPCTPARRRRRPTALASRGSRSSSSSRSSASAWLRT